MINFKDFKTGGILHWQEVKFSGSFPCRWGHSIVNYKNKLYVFGYIFSLIEFCKKKCLKEVKMKLICMIFIVST